MSKEDWNSHPYWQDNPDAATAWENAGFDNPAEAFDWRTKTKYKFLTKEHWETKYTWRERTITPQEAEMFKDAGLNIDDANAIFKDWGKMLGIDNAGLRETIDWYKAGFPDAKTAMKWKEDWNYDAEEAKRLELPVRPFRNADTQTAGQLYKVGFDDAYIARGWAENAYWSKRISEAFAWYKAGFTSPRISSECAEEGLTPDTAGARYSELEKFYDSPEFKSWDKKDK